uniref:Putative SUMO-activating enzyme 1A transcript 1 n=1 Tax=Linum usitatissimum TaxID=4006 RepID=F6LC70_LINUS|nr:putative SUMO-activating enzyme 1A transcript 1 [Linum usitatissimum]
MDGEQLTEQETALYDRQIRVWGADAQRRLSKSHILVYGMKGTIAEFCKNIVLAGVGSVTLMDDRAVTEEALASNFLIPRDENVYSGRSLAELCCDSLKEFNPMVRVSVEKGWGFLTLTNVSDICCSSFNVLAKLSDLVTMGFQFFEKFDVIVISCCPLATKKAKADGLAAEYEIPYPSFQEAINAPWGSLHRKTSKLYFAMRVIERFEEANNRNPGNLSSEDVPAVLQFKRQLCEAQSVSEALVPDTLLERLVMGSIEFPPVCAIVGGILGQEVIKAISGKGDPLKNFFYFDVVDGKGVIEDISTMAPETEPAAAVPPTILEL